MDCGGKQSLTASGSTAQANAMTHFVDVYEKACAGKTVDYTANGSGAGVREFLSGTTDFGGSDSPLAGEEYATAKQRCGGADAWNLPVVFGPLAVTVNLADVDVLVLDGPTLAKIFSGAVTRWDDPAITALNPGMPAEDIHVIYRSDDSGTTDNFQQYLEAAGGGAWTKAPARSFSAGSAKAHPVTRAPPRPSRTPRDRSPITNGPSPSPRVWRPRTSRRPRARPSTSAVTGSARPSTAPNSRVRATTSCSTSRPSTTLPRKAHTPSCWPATRSSARNTPTPRSARLSGRSCKRPSRPGKRI